MDGAPASRITYDEPVTLPDGTETIARCAWPPCRAPFVPRGSSQRFHAEACREAARNLTATRIATNRRSAAAAYARDGVVYRSLRKWLTVHRLLTPTMDAAVRALRGRHDLTLAEGRALLGLPPSRRPRKAPPPSDTPSPVVTLATPRTTPPAVTAVDPWSLPSPDYADAYLPGGTTSLLLRGLRRPLTLRHVPRLHGLVSHLTQRAHDTRRAGWALYPLGGDVPRGMWAITWRDADLVTAARATLRASEGQRTLGTVPVTVELGPLWRVKAPPPRAPGRYRVRVSTLTPVVIRACGENDTSRTRTTPAASNLANTLAQNLAPALGLGELAAQVGVELVARATEPSFRTLGAKGEGEAWGGDGRVRGFTGELVLDVNAVGRWLLDVVARGWGLGGRVALGFGRVRIEDLDASTPVAQARSVYTVPMSSLSPRAQETTG